MCQLMLLLLELMVSGTSTLTRSGTTGAVVLAGAWVLGCWMVVLVCPAVR